MSGGVSEVRVERSQSTNAHITRLRIEYGPGTRGNPPQSLILKTVAAGSSLQSRFINDSEVNYYARDYLELADAPIPKCYAAHAADDGSYSILMEDLSDTHEKDTSPNREYGLAVATALGRLHAFGWGEQRIHQLGGRVPDEAKLAQYIGHVRQGLESLLEQTRMEIPDSWRKSILDIFQYHPGKMLERTKDTNGFTIVHGDLNPGNVLYPKKNREPTRYISLRSMISARRANTGKMDAKARTYPTATQLTICSRASNSRSSAGNANCTMLASN